MRRNLKGSRRAFTLLEMMVVVGMFGLITTVVATLFVRGVQVYRHGETHIELQRSGRQIASRLNPYITSMFNAATLDDPVLVPRKLFDDPETANLLRFVTTEDWCAADYPSATSSSLFVDSAAELGRYVYEVRLNENQDLVLNRLAEIPPNTEIDPEFSDPLSNPTPTDSLVISRLKNRDGINPERLMRIDENGAEVPHFQFTQIRSNLLVLSYTLTKRQTDSEGAMTISEPFRITFNLPTKII